MRRKTQIATNRFTSRSPWRSAKGPNRLRLRLAGVDEAGPFLRPLVLRPTMGTKYLTDKRWQQRKRGCVALDACVDRLSGYDTVRQNLRHRAPLSLREAADTREWRGPQPLNLT